MRKYGTRGTVLALAIAITAGGSMPAYAQPAEAASSGVVVAGQTRVQTNTGGPGAAQQSQNSQNPSPDQVIPGQAPGQTAQPETNTQTPVSNQEPSPQTPAGSQAPSESQAPSQAPGEDQTGAGQSGQGQQTVVNTAAGAILMETTPGVNGSITNISMKLEGIDGEISYGVYVNHGGYLPWKGHGVPAGGTEESTYIEAIQVAITGEAAKHYNVYYRGTSAYAGQHGWACNEELMGTIDRGDYLTSFEIQLVPKEAGAPGSYEGRFYSNHSEQIRISDDGSTYFNGDGSGYTGWIDHDRARYYFQDGHALTGWNYVDGMKFYFNQSGALIMDVDDIIGKQKSYKLRVNKELNCLTVFAKDGDNGYILPVKSMLTSVGDDTPVGTFKTPEKYRWRLMVNDTYTQYATRIIAGQGFLFHSITYEKADPMTLITSGYNNLGVTRSLGCVRLNCLNAKWVYDNCSIGTEVEIYNDASVPGPFYKPYQVWIPENQTWDPTDPAVAQ